MTAPASKINRTAPFEFAGTTITIHPWFAEPLALGMADCLPLRANLAKATNPNPPSPFSSGPLPPFTASGVDPADLMELPWGCRHAAALETDRGQVLLMIEQFGDNANAFLRTPGLDQYIAASLQWLNAPAPNPADYATFSAERQQAYTDAHAAYYGDFLANSAGAQRQAELDAQNQAFADMAARNPQHWQR